jgi:mRNA interferase MazF
MVSSQLDQTVPDFDEVIRESDPDFARSGLKRASVLRISRLAVTEASVLVGALGEIEAARLARVRQRLAGWLSSSTSPPPAGAAAPPA